MPRTYNPSKRTYNPSKGWDEITTRLLKLVYEYPACVLKSIDHCEDFVDELERMAEQIRKDCGYKHEGK